MLAFLHRIYIRLVAGAIWSLEWLFFYPKLRAYYQQALATEESLTILDVGANRGQSIQFFLSLEASAQIHAFEPNRRLYKHLQQSFQHPHIHLYQQAISSQIGELLFHENVLDETSSLERPQTESQYARQKSRILLVRPGQLIRSSYAVAVTTIDAFLAEAALQQVTVLKLDVEGHELAALQGASEALARKQFAYIQLESHADDMYAHQHEAIDGLLRSYGYVEEIRIKHPFGHLYEVVYGRALSMNQ